MMGQVMSRLMPQVKGRADGRVVNEVVRGLLQDTPTNVTRAMNRNQVNGWAGTVPS